MKSKPSLAFKTIRGGRQACQETCISFGKTHNLTNYLFSDDSSAHFDNQGNVKVYPHYVQTSAK